MIGKIKGQRILSRLHDWVHHHKLATYLVAGSGVVLTTGLVGVALFYQKPVAAPAPVRQTVQPKPKPQVVYHSLLTGEQVDSKETINAPVTAIVLENSPDARPQSGLKDAGIVYEAIAEGGITRFMALYQHKKPALIGPIRSLRMYFVDWLAPYNASVAHVGGSYNALQEIRSGNYRDLDQFFNAGTYWRASDRYAPHNVYTSFENLDALNKTKGYTESAFTGFNRVDGKAAEQPTASKVNVNFSSSLYNTSYTYDRATNTYARSLAGVPHVDRESGQITPASIVVMHVNMKLVMEDGWREQIDTTGSGDAMVFQNGTAQSATWHKATRTASILLTGEDGQDIPLVRGQTWIAAIPIQGGSVTWQ